MRNELRQLAAGYVVSVIALVAWPRRSSWINVTVFALWLGGLIAGSALWMRFVERSGFWTIVRGDPSVRLGFRRLRAVASVASVLVFFLVSNGWPIGQQVPVRPNGAPIPPNASTFDHLITVDYPKNTARVLVVVTAFLFTIALGSVLLSVSDRTRQRSKRPRTESVA